MLLLLAMTTAENVAKTRGAIAVTTADLETTAGLGMIVVMTAGLSAETAGEIAERGRHPEGTDLATEDLTAGAAADLPKTTTALLCVVKTIGDLGAAVMTTVVLAVMTEVLCDATTTAARSDAEMTIVAQ